MTDGLNDVWKGSIPKNRLEGIRAKKRRKLQYA